MATISISISNLYFGVFAVFIAVILSIFQFFAENGYKIKFEGFLVGPDCAVAGATLSLHTLYEYLVLDGRAAFNTVLWWEKFSFGFGPLLLCIGVFLFALDSRDEAIRQITKKVMRQNDAQMGIIGWLTSTVRRVKTWIRGVAQLLRHSVPNVGVGGTAVFIAAVATVAKWT